MLKCRCLEFRKQKIFLVLVVTIRIQAGHEKGSLDNLSSLFVSNQGSTFNIYTVHLLHGNMRLMLNRLF